MKQPKVSSREGLGYGVATVDLEKIALIAGYRVSSPKDVLLIVIGFVAAVFTVHWQTGV